MNPDEMLLHYAGNGRFGLVPNGPSSGRSVAILAQAILAQAILAQAILAQVAILAQPVKVPFGL